MILSPTGFSGSLADTQLKLRTSLGTVLQDTLFFVTDASKEYN